MNIINRTSEIKKHIANANIERAISELSNLVSEIGASSIENEVIIQSSQFNLLSKRVRQGLIEFQEENIQINRISSAVLSVLSNIEKNYSDDNESKRNIVSNSNIVLNNALRAEGDIFIGDEPSFPARLTTFPKIEFEIIGREKELKELKKLIDTSALPVLLTGLPGIGKSILVKLYYEKYYDQYKHIVYLSDIDRWGNDKSTFLLNKELIKNLRLENENLPDRLLEKEIIKKLIRISSEKEPSLLILDDSIETSEIHKIKRLIESSNWKILIVSSGYFNDTNILKLENLPISSSKKLFYSIYSGEPDDKAFYQLVEAVGKEPLLIRQIAKLGNELNLSLGKMSILFKDKDLLFNFPREIIDFKKLPELGILFAVLEVNKINEEHKILLQCFSMFVSIPMSFAQLYLISNGKNNEHEFEDLLQKLILKGIIFEEKSRYSLSHLVIKEAIDERFPKKEKDYLELIDLFNKILFFDQNKDNPTEIFEWIPFVNIILNSYKGEENESLNLLHERLGLVVLYNGDYLEARALFEKALAFNKKYSGGDSIRTAKSYTNLAESYKRLGDFGIALENQLNAIEILEHIDTGINPDIAIGYSNLSDIYKNIGKFDEALELLEKSLRINQELYGLGHPQVASNLSSLGEYFYYLKNYDKSLDYQEKALKINSNLFGDEHPAVATNFSNLGFVYFGLEEFQKAKENFSLALSSNIKNFGETHPNTAISYSNLSLAYKELGSYEDARRLLELAINGDLKNFGNDSLTTASSLFNLANLHEELERYQEANEILNKSLEIFIRYDDRFNESKTLYRLGVVHQKMGKPEKALFYAKESISIKSQLGLSETLDFFFAQSNLASIYQELGLFETALEFYEKALSKANNQFKNDSPIIKELKHNIAVIYHDLGKTADSQELLDETLSPVNEAKVIFIGDSDFGKTHLIEYLKNEKIERENIKTTHGIERNTIFIPHEDNEIKLNVWDLGGQEFMHNTHQFFFTNETIYVLVTLARKEQKDLIYWLNLIDQLATGAPVIIAINKVDTDKQDIDRGGLLQAFPNIQGFVRTTIYDCDEITALDSINSLRGSLSKVVTNAEIMPGVFKKQNPGFFAVKNALEKIEKDFITFQEFESLNEIRLLNSDEKKGYLSLLNTIGTIVSYVNDARLIDTNVIKPQWIMDGVYKILNDEKIKDLNNGAFALSDLSTLLNEEKFPIHRHGYLLGLMEKFLICYPTSTDKKNYLLPDLFSDAEPKFEWDANDSMKFRFDYDHFNPQRLITQFIVLRHTDIKETLRWRSGVIITNGVCEAKIYRSLKENHINIELNGEKNQREQFRYAIEDTFRQIHSNYSNLKHNYEIYHKHEKGDIWISYEVVLKYKELDRPLFVMEINDDVDVLKLLDEYPPSPEMVESSKVAEQVIHVTVKDGGVAVIGKQNNPTINVENKPDFESVLGITKEEKWYKQWWFRGFSISLILSTLSFYYTQSFDVFLGVFAIILVYFLLRNPKRRFYRAAFRVLSIGLSIIGILNFLPALNGKFQFVQIGENGFFDVFFKLNIKEEPVLNVFLIILSFGLSAFLFHLDSKRND